MWIFFLVFKLLLYSFCIVVLSAVYFYLIQNKIVYLNDIASQKSNNPEENLKGFKDPSEHNINFTEVFVITKDMKKLHGWLMKQKNSQNAETILYFHERIKNMGYYLQAMKTLYFELNCNVLVVSYRGYLKLLSA